MAKKKKGVGRGAALAAGAALGVAHMGAKGLVRQYTEAADEAARVLMQLQNRVKRGQPLSQSVLKRIQNVRSAGSLLPFLTMAGLGGLGTYLVSQIPEKKKHKILAGLIAAGTFTPALAYALYKRRATGLASTLKKIKALLKK